MVGRPTQHAAVALARKLALGPVAGPMLPEVQAHIIAAHTSWQQLLNLLHQCRASTAGTSPEALRLLWLTPMPRLQASKVLAQCAFGGGM